MLFVKPAGQYRRLSVWLNRGASLLYGAFGLVAQARDTAEQDINLSRPELPCFNLIEHSDDPESPISEVSVDILEQGLINIEFDEA